MCFDLTFVAPEHRSPNLNCSANLSIENLFMGFSSSLINYFCIALMSFILKMAFDGYKHCCLSFLCVIYLMLEDVYIKFIPLNFMLSGSRKCVC
jgi:hypothetical protein